MQLDDVARALNLLGDPTRLRILHMLWRFQDRRLSVNDLVALLALPQPTVSRHLAILHDGGLLDLTERGLFHHYRLADRQQRLHQLLLQALEAFVPSSPEAREDLRRAAARFEQKKPLTDGSELVIKELLFTSGDTEADAVFAALGNRSRRRMVDIIKNAPGSKVHEVAEAFDMSRIAVMRHLRVLESAGLIHSMRSGRERHLYYNAVPLQLIYDRWTSGLGAVMASQVASLKYAVEAGGADA